MRKLLLIASLLVSTGPLVASGAAHAQPAGAIGPTGDESDVPTVLNEIAQCMAQRRGHRAQQILALPFQSRAQQEAIVTWTKINNDCMLGAPADLRVEPALFAGRLAEQMFLSHFARKEVAWLADRSAHATPRDPAEDLALCLVSRNTGDSRALLDSEPGSDREGAIVARLVPSLQGCALQGMTLHFVPASVRMFAAAGLYLAASGAPA